MATNVPFDWRRYDRRLFLAAAILFPLTIIIGFGPTYYFKPFTVIRPLPSTLVHLHAIVMSAWVLFFITQVWLIRSKRAKVHMRLGMIGIALATLIDLVGFFTAAAAAKNGSPSTPPGVPPLAFLVVPLFDLVIFSGLFAAAIYYRSKLATHKRLMLLTVVNFLPPAVGRLQVEALQSAGPLFFMGFPTVVAIGLVAFDTWRNRKLNVPFLIGAGILIASYPLRMMLSGTDAWMSFATWVTSWAA